MRNYSERQQQNAIETRLKSLDNGFIPFEPGEEETVSQVFERQAQKHPQKIAIKGTAVSYTYQQLNQLSDSIASALAVTMDGKPAPVILLLQHDAPFIACMLGVLKAGGFYIPLDPSFPESRNALIVEDADAAIIVADAVNLNLAHRLAFKGERVICFDEIETTNKKPQQSPGPDDLACIIFTSGSTGRPKGVKQTHRNILQVVRRYTNSLYIGKDDRLILLASCSVTASVAPILSALLNGATLYPFRIREHGFAALAQRIDAEGITVYHSAPSVFRHFARTLPPDTLLPTIRLVRLGGDIAYLGDFELFRKHLGSRAVLVNGYGCSEMSSVWCFYMDANSEAVDRILPIGYPIAGVEAYLRGPAENSDALPGRSADFSGTTATGEIVLKSSYISPGYWRRPDLTAAVFSEESNGPARIYRTGDLGFLRPDGCLVHIGRVDSQVKISGMRVETSEIEAYLRGHEGIRDAAVIAHTPKHGEQELLAFVVLDAVNRADALSLRSYLQSHLPAHMVPAAVVAVEELPATPNGKLDRARLLRLKDATLGVAVHVPPSTNAEQRMAALWMRILKCGTIGIDDNFFLIGGNSLLALRVLTELRSEGAPGVSLKTFFEMPTIRQLAGWIVAGRGQDGGLPDLGKMVRPEVLPLSFSQQRLWFLAQMQGISEAYHISFGRSLLGYLDSIALRKALNCILARHEALRTTFGFIDGGPVQRITSAEESRFYLLDEDLSQHDDAPVELDRLTTLETCAPFDLDHGPLIRGG